MTIIFIILFIGVIVYFYTKEKNKPSFFSEQQPIIKKELLKEFDVMISGYSNLCENSEKPRQKHIKELEEFDPIYLNRDYENETDKNSVDVFNIEGFDIGFISKNENAEISKLLDNDNKYEAFVKKIITNSKREKIPVIIIEFYK